MDEWEELTVEECALLKSRIIELLDAITAKEFITNVVKIMSLIIEKPLSICWLIGALVKA